MNRRSLLLLCGAIVLLVLFVLGALLFEQNLVNKEQSIQATATTYVPTTAPLVSTQPTKATEPEVITAPDFVITDSEGKTYGVKNFKGRPTVICFWTFGSKDALRELDVFQELHELYGNRIHLLMIHRTDETETKEAAEAFLLTQRYTFPVYFDTLGSAATAYKVTKSPTSYFMTATNILKARSVGRLDAGALPKALEAIGIRNAP